MRKNRHFVMFIFMLIMMTMMATLVSRQFPQTALVEVFLDYDNNMPGPNSFLIQNITDGRLEFTKRYEVRQVSASDDSEGVLVHSVEIGEIFFIDSGERQVFTYDLSGNVPEFMQVALAPGMYVFAIIYTFSDAERTHSISIHGHEFVVGPY